MNTKIYLSGVLLGALLLSGCSTLREGGEVRIGFVDNGVRDLMVGGGATKGVKKGFVKGVASTSSNTEGAVLSAKDEATKVTVNFQPPYDCISYVEVINEGSSLVQILWDQSSLSFGSGNAERPIPSQQVLASGSVAPSAATPTVIAPGGKFMDVILSLDRVSTKTAYKSLYQGTRYVGTVSGGTYVSIAPSINCEYVDFAERKRTDELSEVKGGYSAGVYASEYKAPFESLESWEARVIKNAESKYLDKPLNALITVEVDGVKHPLQFSFVAKSFKAISYKALEEAKKTKK